MKSEKVFSVINYFLYFLLLIALGIILYLVYLSWESQYLKNNGSTFEQPLVEKTDTSPEGSPEEQQYVSKLASFSYLMPEGWQVEEKPEADYAIIRNQAGKNIISIRVMEKPESLVELPFDQYATQAAKNEIQGYESLESIEQITTESGLTGYKTTWKIKFLGGEEFISNPITYFEHPLNQKDSIQITLESADYASEYNLLINSFRIEGSQ